MRALALSGVLFLVACGDRPPAKSNDVDIRTAVTADAEPASTPAPPASAAAAPAKKRKPYEIVNLCPKTVTILFGEDPKAPNVGSKTLAGNDKIDDGPRDPDGNQIIHLMVRGEPLVKVRVSRATKRVEIGTSCDTLEMH